MRPLFRSLLALLLPAMLAAPLPAAAIPYAEIPPALRHLLGETAPSDLTGALGLDQRAILGADAHSRNMRRLAHVPLSTPALQSDLAFSGRLAFAGNYNGFRVIDVSNPEMPLVLADVFCPGPQNDVTVWGDLLILSVDSVRNKPTCDSVPARPATDPNAWEGLRIFHISQVLSATPGPDGLIRSVDPIAAVATDCGSHTHTQIPDLENNRLLIYVSSYPLRSGPRCGPENAARFGYDPLHRKISVVEVPLANPAAARVIATPQVTPPVFDLEKFPSIPRGIFNPIIGCHDIQVFLELKLAAAACSSEGQIWDISDPANPRTTEPLWRVLNPNVHFYHSAAFTWDGKVTIFGDEVIEGTSCQSPADMHGRLWFYDTRTGVERGSFLIPRAQAPDEYCSVHLFNVVPGTDERYLLVGSWYQGGTSVVDFTKPARAREIGYYDPAATIPGLGSWSAYWHNGLIYANDIDRGVDIYRIRHAALEEAEEFDHQNPQTQLELEDD